MALTDKQRVAFDRRRVEAQEPAALDRYREIQERVRRYYQKLNEKREPSPERLAESFTM
jgi:hypothetical protein